MTIAGICLAAVAAGPETLVRTKAPARWGIAGGSGARVLVMVGGALDGESCRALQGIVERLRTFGVRGMASAQGCRTVWAEGGDQEVAGVRAVVVDGAGVVRYEGR